MTYKIKLKRLGTALCCVDTAHELILEDPGPRHLTPVSMCRCDYGRSARYLKKEIALVSLCIRPQDRIAGPGVTR